MKISTWETLINVTSAFNSVLYLTFHGDIFNNEPNLTLK